MTLLLAGFLPHKECHLPSTPLCWRLRCHSSQLTSLSWSMSLQNSVWKLTADIYRIFHLLKTAFMFAWCFKKFYSASVLLRMCMAILVNIVYTNVKLNIHQTVFTFYVPHSSHPWSLQPCTCFSFHGHLPSQQPSCRCKSFSLPWWQSPHQQVTARWGIFFMLFFNWSILSIKSRL